MTKQELIIKYLPAVFAKSAYVTLNGWSGYKLNTLTDGVAFSDKSIIDCNDNWMDLDDCTLHLHKLSDFEKDFEKTELYRDLYKWQSNRSLTRYSSVNFTDNSINIDDGLTGFSIIIDKSIIIGSEMEMISIELFDILIKHGVDVYGAINSGLADHNTNEVKYIKDGKL